jgi:hypothetical protein
MATVHLLVPVGDDEEEREGGEGAGEEAEQIEGGGVRPVEVFEQEEQGMLGGDGDEDGAELGEEIRLAGGGVEAGEGWGMDREGQGAHAQGDLEPGAIGRGFGAVVAVTGEDEGTGIGGSGRQGMGERGLADTGLTADEHEATVARKGGSELGMEEGEFVAATDKGQGRE